MKKITSLIVLMSCSILILAQVPQGLNYQAIARDNSGNPITGETLQIDLSLQTDTSASPLVVWEELHNPVVTNAFGMFNIVIGQGERQSGTALSFDDIDWASTPLFLKVKVFYNDEWTYMGSAQLWSVPYSMVAGDLEGAVPRLSVVGEDTQSEEALFEVKRKDGETIFAVYNHGVRIFMPLDTLSKGRKGGFAIGGFDKSKGTIQDYFVVSPDSIRAYIDTTSVKAKKGGFAIGGFDKSKSGNNQYFYVMDDSTRINVANSAKGVKGGFAIGGFDKSKGSVIPFVSLTPRNYFIGHETGSSITTGLYNSFLGYQAGKTNSNGSYNIFIGYQAGLNTEGPSGEVGGSEGSFNCFMGYQAGYSNIDGANNTFLGYASGWTNTSDHNTFVGSLSGYNNTSGYSNTFLGTSAGFKNTTGGSNVFLGSGAGNNVSIGGGNTFVGNGAGANIKTGQGNIIIGASAAGDNYYAGYGGGSSNILIGFEAGYTLENGSSNIFIGNKAGYDETGSDKLVISNSDTSTPLVSGDFGLGTFRVNGDVEYTGAVVNVSDSLLKINIEELQDVSEKLTNIRAVKFDWNQSVNCGLLLKDGRQIGLIAQEVERVFPELVLTNDKGYKMIDYTKFAPVLLEAFKEQQKMIDSQQKEIDELRTLVKDLMVARTK
jgi:hypothetical protein